MELLAPLLEAYLAAHGQHGDPLLEEMEARAEQTGFPIVGPLAGQFLYQVARLAGARRVFELGSGYGYSTLWLARAVRENGGGEVHHTVWDEELSNQARTYLDRAGVAKLIRFHVAEAVATLRETPGPFDLIFNDIAKEGYPASLPVIKEKLRPGGVLVVDNMFFHGRVLTDGQTSPDAHGVRSFTEAVYGDPEFTCSMIPLRDGLLFALRRLGPGAPARSTPAAPAGRRG